MHIFFFFQKGTISIKLITFKKCGKNVTSGYPIIYKRGDTQLEIILKLYTNLVSEILNVAVGEPSMNKTTVYKFYKRFQEDHEDV